MVTCVNLLQASSVLAPHAGELFPQQLQLEGDRFPVPDTPGLGVEANLETISQYQRHVKIEIDGAVLFESSQP